MAEISGKVPFRVGCVCIIAAIAGVFIYSSSKHLLLFAAGVIFIAAGVMSKMVQNRYVKWSQLVGLGFIPLTVFYWLAILSAQQTPPNLPFIVEWIGLASGLFGVVSALDLLTRSERIYTVKN